MRTAKPLPRRGGFTLIELLVVIGIIIVIATLAVLFVPRVTENEKARRASDQVSGMLLNAKQMAKRDGVPTGIRLILDPQSPTNPQFPTGSWVRELHYIQQPDAFSVGTCLGNRDANGNPTNRVKFDPGKVDFSGVGNPTALGGPDAPVQIGDYLEVAGGGLVHYIEGIPPLDENNAPTVSQLFIRFNPATPAQVPASANYRIIRQPRLLAGEQPLQLARDIAIDFDPDRNDSNTAVRSGITAVLTPPTRSVGTTTYIEVLFAPSGAVISPGAASDKIIFWLHDYTQDSPFDNEPVLVTAQVRTGFIASHPVNPDMNNPFQFTRDNRSSGM